MATKDIDPAGAGIGAFNNAPIMGEPEFMTLPGYFGINTETVTEPLEKRQLPFQGMARQTWQTVLTVGLPYARIHGMPGESEVLPGLSGPLNPEERAYLQQLLDAEAV